MNVLFLGYVVNTDEVNLYKGASIAGNKMQWNIITNLAKQDTNITCVSLTPHASFPKEKTLIQRHNENCNIAGIRFVNVAYINIPVLKQLTQIIGVLRHALKYLKINTDAVVLCYNMSIHIGIPFSLLKKKYIWLKSACIVADLPLPDDFSRKGIYSALTKIGAKIWIKNLKKCDKYIVLNENAAKQYIDNKPYIIVDGGVDEKDIVDNRNALKEENEDKNHLHIVFAGSLVEYNGILDLIKAMDYIEDNRIILDIYGSGILEKEIVNSIHENKRIIFHGRVSNKEVLSKQRKAWLIIATRHVDDPITKVTFPSKTFEILLSGTPFLTSKLECYLKEYSNYMFFIEENTPKGIAIAIKKLLLCDPVLLEQKAQSAKEYVLKEKRWSVQAEKIRNFISYDEQ